MRGRKEDWRTRRTQRLEEAFASFQAGFLVIAQLSFFRPKDRLYPLLRRWHLAVRDKSVHNQDAQFMSQGLVSCRIGLSLSILRGVFASVDSSMRVWLLLGRWKEMAAALTVKGNIAFGTTTLQL